MGMGRPIKYTDPFIEKEAEALLAYAKKATIPYECHFAPKRGYSSKRLSEWAARNAKVKDALEQFKDIQQYKIVFSAMSNKINPKFAYCMLKNVAGWRDRREVIGDTETKIILIQDKHDRNNNT